MATAWKACSCRGIKCMHLLSGVLLTHVVDVVVGRGGVVAADDEGLLDGIKGRGGDYKLCCKRLGC